MKKFLIFAITILIIGIAFTPYIKAENYSKTYQSNHGLDIAIIDIIPYLIREENCVLGDLYISLEIKNIGDVPVEGVKYFGNASFWFRNKNYGSAWGALLMGVMDPGESWIPKGGAGLFFVNFIPNIFTIEYEITPTDSNPDNNYIRQVYLVKGGGLFPFWIRLPFFE